MNLAAMFTVLWNYFVQLRILSNWIDDVFISQVYKTLEHRMVVAEAAQRLRLPLISKDGEIRQEEIEKCSIMSRSSLDSTSTSITISSSSNSTNYTTANSTADTEPGVGGVPNRFLGITPAYLWQTQLQQNPLSMVKQRCTTRLILLFVFPCLVLFV